TSYFFFFQAEDGIRDLIVTGVQTCALPISDRLVDHAVELLGDKPAAKAIEACLGELRIIVAKRDGVVVKTIGDEIMVVFGNPERSEERRVGKECRSGWSMYRESKRWG